MKKKIKEQIAWVVWAVATFDNAQEINDFCRRKLELSAKETEEAIAEAKRRIIANAQVDLDAEIGKALARNDYLYKQAVKMQDLKTAARTQRDRWRLLGIDKSDTPSTADKIEVIDVSAETEELEATAENVRAQLEALNVAPPGLALEDLTRAVVTRFIQNEKKVLCLSQDTEEPSTGTPKSKPGN